MINHGILWYLFSGKAMYIHVYVGDHHGLSQYIMFHAGNLVARQSV